MASRQKSMRLADEAANATRRAVEIRRQLASRRCINILRAHPWVAEDVERLLEDLGITEDENGVIHSEHGDGKVQSRQSTRVRERDERLKADKKRKLDDAMNEAGVDDPNEVIPPKIWTISDLTYNLLEKRVLPAIEPDAYSPANIRRACTNTGGLEKKLFLQRHLEYDTGLRIHMEIKGKFRKWSLFLDLIRHCSRERKRRGRDRGFASNFEGDGVFAIATVEADGGIQIYAFVRALEQLKVLVDPRQLPAHEGNIENLYIENNWSEHDAEIRSKHQRDAHGLKLHYLFKPEIFPTPAMQNEQAALPAVNAPRALCNAPDSAGRAVAVKAVRIPVKGMRRLALPSSASGAAGAEAPPDCALVADLGKSHTPTEHDKAEENDDSEEKGEKRGGADVDDDDELLRVPPPPTPEDGETAA